MWYPGHINKAKNAIKKNLKIVNSIIEIVDARAPYSSRAYEFEKLFQGKDKIIILNKADICDLEKTKKWEELYKKRGYKVIKTSLKDVNARNFLIKNVAPLIPVKFNEKTAIIVGAPNVGKSTFINSIKGKKSTNTGNMPGITRGIQWVSAGNNIRILDTPGILFPELYNKSITSKLILIGSLKAEDDEADEAVFYAYEYLKNNYPKLIKKIVDNDLHKGAYEFILEFAKKRNFIKKGGIGDYERGKMTFLKELIDGKYGKITYDDIEEFEEIKI
ncbi:Ras superfamily GTP-binding protein YlqF [Oceanotoga teriensis]|uniref:Ribosome biogenesis GTPase A n=1 Tax=Oceanotoga teriensis TaxID=515440 RepID=A0AA45C8P3_9BACT|nr:ribosome biogenesis GTPase YlqF [Oceanotoga teriensis]PWJ96217.1 Ras superfamily GTP-binding protein YlqF [Oceanotoga teriensis]